MSPGHQHPSYWLCTMNRSLSSTRKKFNYLWYLKCRVITENGNIFLCFCRKIQHVTDQVARSLDVHLTLTCRKWNEMLGFKPLNTLRPGKIAATLSDDIFKCISLNENCWISNKISLRHVPQGLIDNMAALVQIMAWRRRGDKPLSEAMLACCTEAFMRHLASMSQ